VTEEAPKKETKKGFRKVAIASDSEESDEENVPVNSNKSDDKPKSDESGAKPLIEEVSSKETSQKNFFKKKHSDYSKYEDEAQKAKSEADDIMK